jgi:hypothetical protein
VVRRESDGWEQPAARKYLSAVAARERIMAVDARPRTRPVRLTMTSREDTQEVYNRIVYQQGAAILLMLDGWLGENQVRGGKLRLRKMRFAPLGFIGMPAQVVTTELNGTRPIEGACCCATDRGRAIDACLRFDL